MKLLPSVYVVHGISALHTMHPLGGKVIKIPEIPRTLTAHAINLLINLRWGKFFMSHGIGLLMTALSSADLLGNVNYTIHVVEILHDPARTATKADPLTRSIQTL